ncbi:Hsp70 family protein [Acetomicrobium sp. S15 = DSM 107314]|uniref:Hsp70 family protein n=1 Tax=Acetomicrobium sp. S15 = DSM 107314 TaxID=2529858 RepID=UPI0018E10FAD|nr:Hsp70 family protein [Acetomicrobium sp. S15 = DSM 107314]
MEAAKSPPAGIDLGARYAKIAVNGESSVRVARNRWGGRFTPAVVARAGKGWLVGAEAEQMFVRFPESAWWGMMRRGGASGDIFIGGRRWKAEEALAPLFLSLREDAEVELGKIVSSCAIALPVGFPTQRRDVVDRAAKVAGFDEVTFVDKPVAVALSSGVDGKFFVLHVGAISTGASVVVVEKGRGHLLESRSIGIGGADFDRSLAHHLQEKVCDLRLDERDPRWKALLFHAEELKEALSFVERASWFPVAAGFTNAREHVVSRGEIASLYFPLVDSILNLCEPLWRHCGRPRVILAGGGSRLPLLKAQIAARLSKPVPLRFPPEEAEAVGALLSAQDNPVPCLLASDLGIVTAGGDAALILKGGTKLPAKSTRRFAVIGGGRMNVRVVKGGADLARGDIVGDLAIEAADGEEVTVTISADVGGTLNASISSTRGLLAHEVFHLGPQASDFYGRREKTKVIRARMARLAARLSQYQKRRLEKLLDHLKDLEDSDDRLWERGVSLLESLASRLEREKADGSPERDVV